MLKEAIINIIARYNLLLDGHPARVYHYCSLLLGKIPLSVKEKEEITTAAYLHDIGKLLIKKDVLDKSGSLDEKEELFAKAHTLSSITILSSLGFGKDLIRMVLLHHERIDGKGYPYGIPGSEIPLGARIISIADAFDSMISLRTYRSTPLTVGEALKELVRCSNTQFDPFLVNLFIDSLVPPSELTFGGKSLKESNLRDRLWEKDKGKKVLNHFKPNHNKEIEFYESLALILGGIKNA